MNELMNTKFIGYEPALNILKLNSSSYFRELTEEQQIHAKLLTKKACIAILAITIEAY
jgi:hypothetical protein